MENASGYVRELCCPLLGLGGRRNLRSTPRGELVVPFVRSSKVQHRSFSVVVEGRSNLPSDLRVLLTMDSACIFCEALKMCYIKCSGTHIPYTNNLKLLSFLKVDLGAHLSRYLSEVL